LTEFLFCLSETNAATERVFSLTKSTWTSDKTRLGVDALKAVLVKVKGKVVPVLNLIKHYAIKAYGGVDV
jgi:hypothetical protein